MNPLDALAAAGAVAGAAAFAGTLWALYLRRDSGEVDKPSSDEVRASEAMGETSGMRVREAKAESTVDLLKTIREVLAGYEERQADEEQRAADERRRRGEGGPPGKRHT